MTGHAIPSSMLSISRNYIPISLKDKIGNLIANGVLIRHHLDEIVEINFSKVDLIVKLCTTRDDYTQYFISIIINQIDVVQDATGTILTPIVSYIRFRNISLLDPELLEIANH
jgi:hypothetical protein